MESGSEPRQANDAPAIELRGALARSALAAAQIANFCDHVEHNEEADREWVVHAGLEFCRLAVELAGNDVDALIEAYAARLSAVERQRSVEGDWPFDGEAAAREARTWRELQIVQVEHDRHYHPDVFGLSRLDQLRHYTLHAAKLTGALARLSSAEPGARDEWQERRLPDMLLFGIKLHTVMGEDLPAVQLSHPL